MKKWVREYCRLDFDDCLIFRTKQGYLNVGKEEAIEYFNKGNALFYLVNRRDIKYTEGRLIKEKTGLDYVPIYTRCDGQLVNDVDVPVCFGHIIINIIIKNFSNKKPALSLLVYSGPDILVQQDLTFEGDQKGRVGEIHPFEWIFFVDDIPFQLLLSSKYYIEKNNIYWEWPSFTLCGLKVSRRIKKLLI